MKVRRQKVRKVFLSSSRVRLNSLHVEFYEVCTGNKFVFSSLLVRFEFVKVRLKVRIVRISSSKFE